jgi:hypothetical protein
VNAVDWEGDEHVFRNMQAFHIHIFHCSTIKPATLFFISLFLCFYFSTCNWKVSNFLAWKNKLTPLTPYTLLHYFFLHLIPHPEFLVEFLMFLLPFELLGTSCSLGVTQ